MNEILREEIIRMLETQAKTIRPSKQPLLYIGKERLTPTDQIREIEMRTATGNQIVHAFENLGENLLERRKRELLAGESSEEASERIVLELIREDRSLMAKKR